MTKFTPSSIHGRYILDVKGYACPYPQYYSIEALQKINAGEILEVILDNQPSVNLVQESARKRNCEIISVNEIESNTWKIEIKK